MSTEQAAADMETVIGAFIIKLCGIAPRVARLAGNSLPVRREIDAIVFEVRKELAAYLYKLGDERGEPDYPPPAGATRPSEQAVTDTEEDEPALKV